MEILLVSHKYPPATGGMEKQSFELINGLKTLAKVHTIVFDNSESRLWFLLSINNRIRQKLKEYPGISIVHFNDALIAAVSLLGRWSPLHKRTMTVHGLDIVFPSSIYQKFIVPLYNRFDLIIAVSSATSAACIDRGMEEKKVVVINNGVDPAIRSDASRQDVEHWLKSEYVINCKDKRILLAIGRPVKRKGFSWFIKNVMPMLDPDFILLLIGPVKKKNIRQTLIFRFLPGYIVHKIQLLLGYPSDEQELDGLVNDPGNNTVFRLGKLPLKELTDMLSIADAFIMPNIEIAGDMEGFGLVCLEACMCGATVFASASGGITDAIIDQKNGYLIAPGNASAWSRSLNQINSPGFGEVLTSEAITAYTVNHFSWKKMCAAYLENFSRL